MTEFTHISLFSGIGASDLAAEWAGFKTILLCEIDPDCQKVLKKHFSGVPIIGDIRDVTKQSVIANTESEFNRGYISKSIDGQIQQSGIGIEQNASPDATGNQDNQRGRCDMAEASSGRQGGYSTAGIGNQSITLLTAGVPCQPASAAGKRRGKADDRWLWPEAIRVLSELKPTWAVFENPTGIASLVESGEDVSLGSESDQTGDGVLPVELSNIIRDIEAQGYEVQPVSISAASVGAPHKRQRIFIICHTHSGGLSGEPRRRTGEKSQDGYLGNESGITSHVLNERGNGSDIQPAGSPGLAQFYSVNPDSWESGLEGSESKGNGGSRGLLTELGSYPGWSENWIEVAQRLCSKTVPGVRSLDAGTSAGLLGLSRTTKLKMLGNCNPPQLYYPIYKAIADIENGGKLYEIQSSQNRL